MIQLDGVGQVFDGREGQVTALEKIDLHVRDGEFVTLIGRSGCGKSTLLRLIAGLISPTSGSVQVAGEPVTGPRRDVSFMFQRPALLPWRSVLSNVMLPVEIDGGAGDRRESRGRAAYRRSGRAAGRCRSDRSLRRARGGPPRAGSLPG